MKRGLNFRWILFAILAAAVAAAVTVVVVLHRASETLQSSKDAVAKAHEGSFEEVRLEARVPAGYEVLGAPAQFRDMVSFQGQLFLCAGSGVFVYDNAGVLRNHYRAGFELPSTRLIAVAAGKHELYIATENAGLLVFAGQTRDGQTRDGQMPAGQTPAGQTRDGQTFRQLVPQAAESRRLTAVLALETGRVLLGTQKAGVLVYDGHTIVPFHPALADVHVTALAGNEGDLWVGTIDRGVLHWRGGQVETLAEAAGLPDVQVTTLAVRGNTAYVGTPLGVAEFVEGKPRRTLGRGLMAKSMLALKDSLLVGTLEQGAVEIPLGRGHAREYAIPARVERIVDLDDVVYTLAPDGLYRDGKAVLRHEDVLLADNNISALAADREGRLWIGYFDRGLDIVQAGHAQHSEDEHAFCVNRIVVDLPRNETAVATANGLLLFDATGRERQVLGRKQGLIADHVTDVLARGNSLIVATPAGITILDEQGARSLYAFHGLVNNHVYALAAFDNRILAGTLGGISVLEGDRPTARYTTANSALKQNWISAIATANHESFVGTYGDGVMKLGADGLLESIARGFEVNPNAMLTSGSRVLAGTLSRGLYVYDRGSSRGHFTTVGLPSVNVTALAVRDGILYIGTDNGLVRVSERDLQ